MVEISPEQREQAQKYMEAQQDKQRKAAEFQQVVGKCEKEADAMIKFLEKQSLKTHKSILVEHSQSATGQKQERTFSIEYIKGTFTVYLTVVCRY